MSPDISMQTTTYQVGNRQWLLDEPDFKPNVTLDISKFTAGTHYPNGYIPSGTVIGKVSASGKFGPYDSVRDGLSGVVADVVSARRVCRVVRGVGFCVVPAAWNVVDVVGCGDVIEVPGGVEGVEAVCESFGKSFGAGDGDHACGIEYGSGLFGPRVFAPVGEHVDVLGDVGDQAEAALVQRAAAFGKHRRFGRERLHVSVFRKVWHR